MRCCSHRSKLEGDGWMDVLGLEMIFKRPSSPLALTPIDFLVEWKLNLKID